MRAIAFELNQGYSLDETLEDLNISREENVSYVFSVERADGVKFTGMQALDLYSEKGISVLLTGTTQGQRYSYYIYFTPVDCRVTNGSITLSQDKYKIEIDNDDYWDVKEDVWKSNCKEAQKMADALGTINITKLIAQSRNFRLTV